jgi:lysozyme family protein
MSMYQFSLAWTKTADVEKGYVCDKDDSGGETCYGITLATARAFGYTGSMQTMSKDIAMQIAKQAYWDVMLLDDISAVSVPIAMKLFDMGYLCGQSTAAVMLQRGLNALNRDQLNQPIYTDVLEDFHIGKLTVYALTQLFKSRGKDTETVVLRVLNSQEGAHFIDVCKLDNKNRKFSFGWFLNRVGV